jgi:hypothetical protein
LPFTEFTARSGGSNLNAGTLDGINEAGVTPLATFTNGAWNGSNTFTAVVGADLSALAVGQFVAVYPDGTTEPTSGSYGAGRINSINTGLRQVVISLVSFGTAQGVVGSGKTIVVGGAYRGPNGTSAFPFNFIQNTLTNAALNPPRINLKNDQTYNVTAAMTTSGSSSEVFFKGYSSTFDDTGLITIDGGTSGASYTVLTAGIVNTYLENIIFANNGATGSADLLAGGFYCHRVVVHDAMGSGFALAATLVTECEAYACNKSNTAAKGGFTPNGGSPNFRRCKSHHNTGSNSHGFRGSGHYIDCISDANGGNGMVPLTGALFSATGCVLRNNGASGISSLGNSVEAVIENCTFVGNVGPAISDPSNGSGVYRLLNNAFGSGTRQNNGGAGNFNFHARKSIRESGSVTYPANVSPFVDPDNGNFNINLAAAKGAGRGTFTETAPGYSGTVGYPDIGPAQHQDAGGFVPMIGSPMIGIGRAVG